MLALLTVTLLLTAPAGAPLRGDGGPAGSPLMTGVAFLVAVVSGIGGITFGVRTGAIRTFDDVPATMATGIVTVPPDTAQAAFRIADSGSTSISPMSPYFLLALGFLQRYGADAGIGTLVSFTLPPAFFMTTTWAALFFVWWGLGIPLGPGAPVR